MNMGSTKMILEVSLAAVLLAQVKLPFFALLYPHLLMYHSDRYPWLGLVSSDNHYELNDFISVYL